MIWRWRYLYARPFFNREALVRSKTLREQGAEQLALRALVEGVRWVPWWKGRPE